MDKVNQRFSDKYRSHWIKVKFYHEKPKDDIKRLEGVRFCEATKEAILHPILLDKESISCPGAQHAFGWKSLFKNDSIQSCCDKRPMREDKLKTMISGVPFLRKPFKYIGLNTEGIPDLVMSYVLPQEAMALIKTYNNKVGENLDVSLCTMMAVCGGVAVKSYLDEKISFSFGCDDSRKFADMRRENLVVGIPKKLFQIFFD